MIDGSVRARDVPTTYRAIETPLVPRPIPTVHIVRAHMMSALLYANALHET